MVCYKNDLLNTEADYDSLGVAFRDNEGVYIVFDLFGETKVRYPHLFQRTHFLVMVEANGIFQLPQSAILQRTVYEKNVHAQREQRSLKKHL